MGDFGKGFVLGAGVVTVIFGLAVSCWFFHQRDKKLSEYVEVQNEIERVYEDYNGMGAAEFIEAVPDVRAAADRGIERIRRKRDEVIQRVRSGSVIK
jgi:hypothetical protein